MLQKIVDEFDRVCKRRKLKVNAGKSKVMVFKRAREQTIKFAKSYRVGSEVIRTCKISPYIGCGSAIYLVILVYTGIPRRTRVFGSVRLPQSANPRWARL